VRHAQWCRNRRQLKFTIVLQQATDVLVSLNHHEWKAKIITESTTVTIPILIIQSRINLIPLIRPFRTIPSSSTSPNHSQCRERISPTGRYCNAESFHSFIRNGTPKTNRRCTKSSCRIGYPAGLFAESPVFIKIQWHQKTTSFRIRNKSFIVPAELNIKNAENKLHCALNSWGQIVVFQ
jgi:hypothetical protein